MQIDLIAIGKRMPEWVNIGYQEYAKRLPAECKLKLTEIPLNKRSKGADIKRLIGQEGKAMNAAVKPGNRIIALAIEGQTWDTKRLANQLAKWQGDGRNISLLIGGPEGLAPDCLAKAEIHWSLSPLTLPHPLVRIVVAEQLYRAWSLLNNHPYHR